MAILITGGAGYIGSHTCVALLENDFEIIVIDNLSNSNLKSLNKVKEITNKAFKFYQVDLLNRSLLESIFQENNIDAVIHFAGLKAVGESVQQPLMYYQNNMTGTLNLCETMKKYDVTKLVFSSSATVYGVPSKVPIKEDFPLNPINPYGQSKWMIERVLQDLAASNSDWSISILRYFNPIGAHKSGKLGEDPNGIPSNLLPYITQVAIGKLPELYVYGNDYPTKDGTGIRDYIHVTDLATAHLKALQRVMKIKGMHVYNIGTGKGYSVLEVIETFEKISGKRIHKKIVDRRPGDAAVCYADPTKAEKELGWVAEKGITEMCRDAWNWQVNNPNGYDTF